LITAIMAIAVPLANDPAVLLMDEPFGALDSQTRHSMQRLLLRVRDHSHKTVLFVTHDIDEAILLGDRVFFMSGRPGQIRKIRTVDFSRPRVGDIVLDPAFIAMKREIMGLLRNDEDEDY
jgi:NitT/TauT family transport system ATP-binding protein